MSDLNFSGMGAGRTLLEHWSCLS